MVAPSSACANGGRRRAGSPCGGSTLMTSAPRSAKAFPAGSDAAPGSSMTRYAASGRTVSVAASAGSCCLSVTLPSLSIVLLDVAGSPVGSRCSVCGGQDERTSANLPGHPGPLAATITGNTDVVVRRWGMSGDSVTVPMAFHEFAGTRRCGSGHTYAALAGRCAVCPPATAARRPRQPRTTASATAVPALVRRFIDHFVIDMDNGVAPRWPHAFGYEQRKIGVVNHIPVCDTLAQLTAYFTGGNAQGSTHFGIGRERAGSLAWDGVSIPCAPVHQYMPIVGPCAPWAQGIIRRSARCPMPPSPTISGMQPGEPNGAFISIENVARAGVDGVTN